MPEIVLHSLVLFLYRTESLWSIFLVKMILFISSLLAVGSIIIV